MSTRSKARGPSLREERNAAKRKSQLEAYLFQRRYLFGCTVVIGLVAIIWVVAIVSDHWYIISGGKGKRLNLRQHFPGIAARTIWVFYFALRNIHPRDEKILFIIPFGPVENMPVHGIGNSSWVAYHQELYNAWIDQPPEHNAV